MFLRALAVALAITSGSMALVYASHKSSTNTAPAARDDASQTRDKKPKLGYPDPFIPPTKGNGF
ncbi:hypothetical protein QA646_30140 (plasmid) [Rhizobium sp. CB3090]|uniref:hypothetical protein n=1 Tax=Rhizobium sp. CB3090 TaxID=3039156 RepID=UPI0024B0CBE8|nr:hypothetical protein [Rhizobium sp. CB3090]WFU13255.1 hypothetical protein QA646_30140 [Rhizobium sp. CB3090]